MKGISRRWFVNTVGLIVVILVTFIVVLSVTVQSYAYNSIQQVLKGRVDELLNVLSSGSGGYKTSSDFSTVSRNYIENFPDKNSMEIMGIDRDGKIFITSTGFNPDFNQKMPDYEEAILSEDNYGFQVFLLNTGEKVMAITRTVRDADQNMLGSIRYMVSLEKADRQIRLIVSTLIFIGMIIILIVFLSGLYFVRSIVLPVQQVTSSARRIAQGDFDVRIQKKKEDEIGQLCDSINDMARELGASEQMKNDFISSVSHELRTPLTSIKGWAETITAGVDPTTEKRGMGVIIHESERLYSIVEELLDFSRLQSGRMVLNIAKIDLMAELGEAVYMFTDLARTEQKQFTYEENAILSPILADVNRLKQIFINILDNAFKYTDENGEINVSTEESDGWISVSISDNGCGIPQEHLLNVKKKFYKANQVVRGSGIGLAVVDEIIKLHGGTFSIQSKEGRGTTVTVQFPTLAFIEQHPDEAYIPEIQTYLNNHNEKGA
ncbi:sensor histidine kinase [Scatolibacter rhodanostii]|uniref:sensor histidine kinase n=1 Tax=Scatolibacter rhodanostii TaxID=2014781 RepID=UPI001FA86E64|nr:HAMP domain-containing sensor histidine kinase [Scatolibacter rhodanostii]